MGGKHLTVPCTLSRNEVTVQIYALADTEANEFMFINTLFAVNLAKYLNMKAQWLPKPLTVKGYNGQNGNSITHILCLHLKINGQRQYNLSLLILDLGNHDLILGWGWLANFWILVDAANCHLQWSEDLQPFYSAIKEVVVKQTAIILVPHSSEHQQDADARNKAFEQDEQRRLAEQQKQNVCLLTRNNLLIPTSLSISTSGAMHEKNMRDSLWRMRQELKNRVQLPDLLRQRKSSSFTSFSLPASIDIFLISEVDFHYNLKDWNVEFRSISLYKIDWILEEQLKAEGQDDKQVAQELSQWHAGYTDVFFKAASDILLIHRPYDHKIILEKESNLRYSSLYKMTTEKLKAVKKYLEKNLHKGFIEPS